MSLNSNSSRPTVSFSLPFALKERLDKLPTGEKSSVAEVAITQYLDQKAARLEADEQLQAAARSLYDSRDAYSVELADIHGKIQALYDHVVFQTTVIETLFGVKKNPPPPIMITNNHYEQALKEAMASYATEPDLLNPRLEREQRELEFAAYSLAAENRTKDVNELIDGMPFMADARFYRDKYLDGTAIFDRNFKQPSYVEGTFEKEDFVVLYMSILNPYSKTLLTFPSTRPYFKINKRDQREEQLLDEIEEIAAAIPIIVADYLAYRRFKLGDNGTVSEKSTDQTA